MDTLFDETLRKLEQSLTVSLIATPLDLEEGARLFLASSDEQLEYALRHKYSRLVLCEAADSNQPRATHIAQVDLQQKLIHAPHRITVDDLISADTPMGKTIEILAQRRYSLVLIHGNITQIVTRSDLNKLPVRVFLNTLLAHLESLLADTIDTVYPENTWLEKLTDNALNRVTELFSKKVAEDFDTRMIDCTTLSDKATIIGKSSEVRNHIHSGSKKAYEKQAKVINRLRDRISHGLPPLDKESDDLRDHLVHGQQLTKEREIAWLCGAVNTMQQWIEALADAQRLGSNDA